MRLSPPCWRCQPRLTSSHLHRVISDAIFELRDIAANTLLPKAKDLFCFYDKDVRLSHFI